MQTITERQVANRLACQSINTHRTVSQLDIHTLNQSISRLLGPHPHQMDLPAPVNWIYTVAATKIAPLRG